MMNPTRLTQAAFLAAALAASSAAPAQGTQSHAMSREEVRQAFIEARDAGALLRNGEIAEPREVIAARRALADRAELERETVAMLERDLLAMRATGAVGDDETLIVFLLEDLTDSGDDDASTGD
jgi:hypothetical protein